MLIWALLARAEDARTVGNLVYDGVPEIPAEVVARARPWADVRSASLLGWHPADGSLLVSTRFAETSQAHRVAAPGAAREQLTFLDEPVAGASWDPADLTGLYVSADVGGAERWQVSWLDRRSGTHTLLTDGASRNQGAYVSPAGGRLAYTSTARNGVDYDLYVVDRHDPATRRRVRELDGDWAVLDGSRDGGRLLLRRYRSVRDSEIHVYDLEAGTLELVSPPASANPTGRFSADGRAVWLVSDKASDVHRLWRVELATGAGRVVAGGGWDVEDVEVSADGRAVAWTVNEGGVSRLYVGDPARPARVDLPTGVVSGLDFDPAGRRLAFTLSTAQSPGDVYTVDARTRAVTRWTTSEAGGLDPTRFATPTLVTFPTFDGRAIPAWYYRPAGEGPFPVVVGIHGGPEGQSRAGFNANAQYWMDTLGAAVILPNVRGSTGYGKAWVALDDGDRRLDSVKDIGALLDWIATRPELDAKRVAVNGASYGGYMVLASLVEFGERVACGVDSVGISDFVTFLENTEAYRRDLRRAEYGDERDPAMRAFLASIAPLRNAARIRSPLFVAQGKNDPRVPVTEAEQIVRTVRAEGGEAWYLLANDEGHGFRRRSNRLAWTAATTVFLERCFAR
ncbi:MAG: prolyl oligopeptidase family serine peptidase [Myxococcota bacterium]